jgi:hypothetical protein
MNQALAVDEYLLFGALCLCTDPAKLPPVEDFVAKKREFTAAACTVAGWLGLVVRDDSSVLRWRPTHAFVDQVMRRKAKWNYPVEERYIESWQEKAFLRIHDEALAEEADDLKKYSRDVASFLAFIGLVRVTVPGRVIPSKRLLALAFERRSRFGEGK